MKRCLRLFSIPRITAIQFELFKPLKHPDGADENNIELGFSVVAEDFDQDQSNAIDLTITVTDDVPLVTTQSITRLEGQNYNGSKVDMFANAADVGADDAALTRIEGITSNGADIVFRTGNNGPCNSSLDLNSGSQVVQVYEPAKMEELILVSLVDYVSTQMARLNSELMVI